MQLLLAIRTISLLGALIFGALLSLTYVAPERLERAGRAFITAQVRAEINDELEHPTVEKAKTAYALLLKRYAAEAERTRAQLKERFAEKVAEIIARLCHFDCQTKSKLAGAIKTYLTGKLKLLEVAIDNIKSLAQEKYSEKVKRLVQDLRIFFSTNLAAFCIVFVASLLRREQFRELMLPSTLLLVSTVASAVIYIFGQNWFFTILFDSYVGYGYLAYISIIFLFLIDITMLHARITTTILDALGSLASSLASICGF